MNTDDGALYVPLTGDSKQFIGAIDEAERRVKGFSSATVAEGKKIDLAFENLVESIKTSSYLIAETEADIKKMEKLLTTISPGVAKVELIGEVNAAKRALKEEKVILAELEQQAKATSGAHVTLRTQLRQMKEELVAMEASGKRGSAEYEVMRRKFADLTNAMGDAQKQANVLANDQAGLQGLVQGLSGVAGVAAAAQGAIGLFSGENENLQKIMLKVQSLMSLTIGLQQLGNVLNKDSAFTLGVVTRAKTALAAAELNLATAFGISTAAARVLMATLTLGLSVAIGVAVAAISRLVTKAQEAKKATQEFNKATAEAAYQSLASFEKMRLEWNRLGDDMKAKNKFINDSKDAFQDLGIQIKGAADAENIFVKNTEAFRTALIERAKSVAAYEMAEALTKTLVEKELERDSTPQRTERYIFSGTPGEKGSTISKRSDKWVKIETERAFLESEIQKLFETGDKAAQNATSLISDIGVTTTENLEKIMLLEQKISEQERLMLEAAEAGNKGEVKVIQDKIEQLREELRLRNMLVNAIYAQSRASELIANVQANAWKPAGSSIVSLGAPSTGGKGQGSRYWQTPVFDLETAKKTLAVMDQQGVNARNSEAVAKKKKKVDEEMKKIAEEELQLRKEIAGAVSETVAMLERAGLFSEQFASQMQGMIGFADNIATGDFIGAIVNGVGMFVDQIARFFDQTTAYEERIKAMNDLLEKQRRLIELSSRKGGEDSARVAEIKTLKDNLAAQEEELAKWQKKLERSENAWNMFQTMSEDKRRRKVEELTAATEAARIAAEDAEQAYTDFLAGGITENTLVDSIVEGLQQGKISVDDFAGYMNDMLTEAVLQSFSSAILGPAITELQEMVAQALLDGVLSEEEAKAIQTRASEIAKENEEKYKEATRGLRTEQDDTTLQGAIKGITEETAGVLAGQVNAMRINQVEGIQIMRTQLNHLAEIAINTRYNKHLQSIDKKLDGLNSDTLRTTGMDI